MQLTEMQLKNFLDSFLTPEKFNTLAALTNLNNGDNFSRIIELLYENKINLSQLNDMEYIDDIGVEKFLQDIDLYKNPYMDVFRDISVGDLNTYLLVDTALEKYFKEFNSHINLTFGKESKNVKYGICVVDLDSSIYSNNSDFEKDFSSKVVSEILKDKNIDNVSKLFPVYTFKYVTADSKFGIFINKLISFLFGRFKEYFTNDKLSELFVWNSYRPSLSSTINNLINNIFNLNYYSLNITQVFSNDLYDLSINNNTLSFNQSQIDILWDKLYNINLNEITINDTLSYILYKISFIVTLEQKNSIPNNTNYDLEFRNFLGFLETYKEIHLDIETRIYSSINCDTL